MSAELSLPFDQYQRYRLVADVLTQLRPKGHRWTILDVGGRTGLLRRFLKRDRIILIDPVSPPRKGVKDFVMGEGQTLPFADSSIDVVCAFDTLEHVPDKQRRAFTRECARVARNHAILAGPYDDPKVGKAEELLQRFLKDKLDVDHEYLREHRELGLPVRTQVEGWLKRSRKGTAVLPIGHGDLDRWLALMGLSLYLDADPALRGLAKELNGFYNAALYASDHGDTVYRHAVVASFSGAPLPDVGELLDPPIAPKGTWTKFQKLLPGVAAFDKARKDWRSERKDFERSVQALERDLLGHRGSLAEVQQELLALRESSGVLEEDLGGHRASLKTQVEENQAVRAEADRLLGELRQRQEELEQTQEQLRERDRELLESGEVSEGLRGDLEVAQGIVRERQAQLDSWKERFDVADADLTGHRETLQSLSQTLEGERSAGELQREGLEADLQAHRASLEELTSERDRWRERSDVQAADLEGHRHSLSELNEKRSELESQVVLLSEDLEAQRVAFAELQNERDSLSAKHTTQSEDLDGHRSSLTEVRADLERVSAELIERGGELSDALDREQALQHRVADLEAQLADQRRGFEASQVQNTELVGIREQVESELTAVGQRLVDTEALLEAERHRAESAEDRNRALDVELGEHRASLGELGELRVQLEAQVKELGERSENQTSELEAGAHAREGLAQELAQERADLSGHRDSLRELSELRTELEVQLAALGSAHESRGVELAERTNERDEALDRGVALEAELAAWQERAAGVTAERDDLQKTRAALESDLGGHRETLQARDLQLERLTEELREAGVQLEARRGELAALVAERDGLTLQRDSLERDLNEHRRALADQEGRAGEQRGRSAESLRIAQEQLTRQLDERGQLEEVLQTIEADLGGHRAALQARETELEDLREAASQYARSRDEARTQLERTQSELRAADRASEQEARERERLSRQRDEAVSESEAARKRLAELDELLDDLRDTNAEAQIEIRKRDQQLDSLMGELTQLRRDLAARSPADGVDEERAS